MMSFWTRSLSSNASSIEGSGSYVVISHVVTMSSSSRLCAPSCASAKRAVAMRERGQANAQEHERMSFALVLHPHGRRASRWSFAMLLRRRRRRRCTSLSLLSRSLSPRVPIVSACRCLSLASITSSSGIAGMASRQRQRHGVAKDVDDLEERRERDLERAHGRPFASCSSCTPLVIIVI